MPSMTFEVTLEFDEQADQGDIHSSLYRVIEAARQNSQLTPDEIACSDVEIHFVGETS
jgi:hypothetical protein